MPKISFAAGFLFVFFTFLSANAGAFNFLKPINIIDPQAKCVLHFEGAKSAILEMPDLNNNASFSRQVDRFNHLIFSNDGSWLIEQILDGNEASVFNVENGEKHVIKNVFNSLVKSADISLENKLYVALNNGEVAGFDMSSKQIIFKAELEKDWAKSIELSRDETKLLVTGEKSLTIFNLSGEIVVKMPKLDSKILISNFNANNKIIFVVTGFLCQWHIGGKTSCQILPDYPETINKKSLVLNNQYLVFSNYSNIFMYRLKDRKLVKFPSSAWLSSAGIDGEKFYMCDNQNGLIASINIKDHMD